MKGHPASDRLIAMVMPKDQITACANHTNGRKTNCNQEKQENQLLYAVKLLDLAVPFFDCVHGLFIKTFVVRRN